MYRMEDEYTNDNSEDKCTFIMYKIAPKNSELKYSYIGHTTNFCERKRHHIRNTTTENESQLFCLHNLLMKFPLLAQIFFVCRMPLFIKLV